MKTVFLYDDLEEIIYIEQLISFELNDSVYLLQKSLYELNKHQANRIKESVNLCVSMI